MRLALPLFLVSATVLGLEIALMRLWMIAEYHHLSYFVISTALLGFGVSGTLISLLRDRFLANSNPVLCITAWGMAFSAPLSFVASQALPLRSLEILWSPEQWGWIILIQILLLIPFLFGALFIGLVLILKSKEAGFWYGINMTGSGIGACLFVLLQYVVPVQQLLPFAALMVGVSAWMVAGKSHHAINAILTATLIVTVLYCGQRPVRINEYKTLPSMLRLKDSEVVHRDDSPLGRIDVISGPAIHEAVDLSPLYNGPFPDQMMITFDGGYGTVLSRINSATAAEFLDWSIPAAGYHLVHPTSVAVAGTGGGSDIHLASYHGCGRIVGIDLNPKTVELVGTRFSKEAGEAYSLPGVEIEIAEARHWLENTEERFDLIVVPLLDSISTASSGVHALNENYLYTVEGIGAMLDQVSPGGALSIIRWVQFPPRDTIKMAATLIEALRQRGVENPGGHLAVVRFQFAANLLVSNEPLSPSQIEAFKAFVKTRNFQSVWYPGMPEAEAGAIHEIGQLTASGRFEGKAAIHDAIREMLSGDPRAYYENSLFDVRPTTDDQPYFFNFFRWKLLPVLYRMGPGAFAQVEYGYFVLVFSFLQAVVLGLLFILLPLGPLRRWRSGQIGFMRTVGYFSALGLSFLLLEMAFIQKTALFLGDPVLAATAVLSSFLIFSGFGSLIGTRLGPTPPVRIAVAVCAILLIGIAYLLGLHDLYRILGGVGLWGRCCLAVLLLAPLAMAMGVPFSQGLVLWEGSEPGLLPWAWGVNGFASVIAASLAVLISMSVGFTVLVLIALGLYLLAGLLVYPFHLRSSSALSTHITK